MNLIICCEHMFKFLYINDEVRNRVLYFFVLITFLFCSILPEDEFSIHEQDKAFIKDNLVDAIVFSSDVVR